MTAGSGVSIISMLPPPTSRRQVTEPSPYSMPLTTLIDGKPSLTASIVPTAPAPSSIASLPTNTISAAPSLPIAAASARAFVAESASPGKSSLTAESAPMANAIRSESVTRSGPAESTVTVEPGWRSRSCNASSIASSSCGEMIHWISASSIPLPSSRSLIRVVVSGTCLIQTKMFIKKILFNSASI